MKTEIVLHQGEKFSATGTPARFAKDVVHVGKWFHPVTGREVEFTPERIQKLSQNTRRYLDAGNKIPFRDGHKDSVLANMGEWVDGFIPFRDALVAVCEPKDPRAVEGMKNGSIDGVSVVIKYDLIDSKKNHYDEVITAVDATDFGVLTEQKGFVQLSKESDGVDVFIPQDVKLAKKDPDADGDVMAQHESLHDDLADKMKAFSKSRDKNGADHAETKAAGTKAQEAALRLRKQAQVIHDHVHNMTGGPVYFDRNATAIDEALSKMNSDAEAALKEFAEAIALSRKKSD